MNAAEIYEMVIRLTRWDSGASAMRVAIQMAARESRKTVEEVEAICDREYQEWAASRGYDF